MSGEGVVQSLLDFLRLGVGLPAFDRGLGPRSHIGEKLIQSLLDFFQRERGGRLARRLR